LTIKLHHIGIVANDITEYAEIFKLLEMDERTSPQVDTIQKVNACFINTGLVDNVYIELIEPTDESSPVTKFLKERKNGLHHLCFEVDNIETQSLDLQKKGFQLVCPPVDCNGYDNNFNYKFSRASKVSFLLFRDRILIELLQKGLE
jgi:methylmalonyl-CoA epimerase